MGEWVDWVGYAAGTCTTVAFVPQVYKTLKTRSTRDISLGMWSIFTFGVAVWLLYGLLIGSLPIVIPNLVTLVLAGTVLAIKLKAERIKSESTE